MNAQKHKDAAAASGLNKKNIPKKKALSTTEECDGDWEDGPGHRSRDNDIYQDFVKKQGGAPTAATRSKHPSSTTHSVAGMDQNNQKLNDAAEDANDMLYKAIMQVKWRVLSHIVIWDGTLWFGSVMKTIMTDFITYKNQAVTSFFRVAVQEDRAAPLLLCRERYTNHHRGHTEAPGRGPEHQTCSVCEPPVCHQCQVRGSQLWKAPSHQSLQMHAPAKPR
jgi:hypothetical protein